MLLALMAPSGRRERRRAPVSAFMVLSSGSAYMPSMAIVAWRAGGCKLDDVQSPSTFLGRERRNGICLVSFFLVDFHFFFFGRAGKRICSPSW
jgi:hypothetical protein